MKRGTALALCAALAAASPAQADVGAPPAIVAWMRAHAVPLATVEAGHGFDDLAPLKAFVGDARIVALGEATHGTREFFQLKHRLLEYLATELGFTVFAIEANFPESLAIDRYVMTGHGDPQQALDGIHFWTWNTEEVLDLIRWMRRYNEDPAHPRKLRFYGFDSQYASVAVNEVLAYLKPIDPTRLALATKYLAPWTGHFDPYSKSKPGKAQSMADTAGLARLASLFDDAREELIRKSSTVDYEWARQELRIIEQCNEMANSDLANRPGVRDRAMAENIKWIVDHEPPGTRMVVWAHNLHVGREPRGLQASMGGHLQRMFGTAMVVFGFAFSEGSFQAVGKANGVDQVREFTVAPAPPGSLDATLAATGIPQFALDLRHAPSEGPVWDWLRRQHASRNIGAFFSDATAASTLMLIDARSAFDALLFVDKTTRARPNWRRRPSAPVTAKAENLDFEKGVLDQPPPGWLAPAPVLAGGYRVALTNQGSHTRERCALVAGAPTKPRSFGNVMQRIDATPYRGKKVRLRASVRMSGTGNAALWMRIDRQNGDVGFFDNMQNRPIKSNQWRDYEIVGEVDPDAASLNFGMMLLGAGQAWLDDVRLEIVDDSSAHQSDGPRN